MSGAAERGLGARAVCWFCDGRGTVPTTLTAAVPSSSAGGDRPEQASPGGGESHPAAGELYHTAKVVDAMLEDIASVLDAAGGDTDPVHTIEYWREHYPDLWACHMANKAREEMEWLMASLREKGEPDLEAAVAAFRGMAAQAPVMLEAEDWERWYRRLMTVMDRTAHLVTVEAHERAAAFMPQWDD